LRILPLRMIFKSMKMFRILLLYFLVAFTLNAVSQTPGLDKSVMLEVAFSEDPFGIVLSWQPFADATSFAVYRKSKAATTWGSPIINGLPGNSTSWTDYEAVPGIGYEYRVFKAGGSAANGYIYAGFELPAVESQGSLVLVVDTLSTNGLEEEIARWAKDAEGDGWRVHQLQINQNDAVTDVKARIQQHWNAAPNELKAVFLLGRVPIPYSGEIAPDGHVPDHLGAWPADGYYGDMNGSWTDNFVNNAGASDPRNRNTPGDGKFDQSTIPSDLELFVGRVDMRNLPQFGLSETELLRRYLNKNHAYRNKQFEVQKKAVIDDNFTGFAEGFAATGWRNFSALCGAGEVIAGDYLGLLGQESHQWAYGCGAGSYNSCSGVASSGDFSGDSLLSVFTVLFGSYFGDWDSPVNNFLRVPLANGTTLSNCWGGRPFWYFHHMALGDPIGYAARLSMNNGSTYDFNNSQRGVHMALMGDPTLRADIVAPVLDLEASYVGAWAELSWTMDPLNTEGYFIYRKAPSESVFSKVSDEPVLTGFYSDICLLEEGVYTYMVRAISLENTNAGSYYNLSTGVCDTLWNPQPALPITPAFAFNAQGSTVFFENTSEGASNFFWEFGDGNFSLETNPVHMYESSGSYVVTLHAENDCREESVSAEIDISLGLPTLFNTDFSVYPNPTSGRLVVKEQKNGSLLLLCDAGGRLLASFRETEIDLSKYESGIYFVGNNARWVKVILEK